MNISARSIRAFSLVELLVGLAVFIIVLLLLVQLTSHAMGIWQGAEDQKTRQQSARLVLDRINRDLEGSIFPLADRNTNRFYFLVKPGFDGVNNPSSAFWQTMSSGTGERGDISEVGYFVRWRTIDGRPVAELCRVEVPPAATDSVIIGSGEAMSLEKIERYVPTTPDASNPMKGVLARNVVGLWFQPFDGTNILSTPYDLEAGPRPTSVEVSLALIDSRTASRLTNATDITAAYQATPAQFLENLPDSVRKGIRILSVRSRIEASVK